ncbi:MAG: MarR family transcriptional regulator [Hyphomonadaceae bacterium]|jgi:DNA-binding MarR family transcriptional regulator|nr:MarR family transcriptional regulator [Hyphomonadaceae bacterium]
MADINSEALGRTSLPAGDRASLPAPDPRFITVVELLFFAYRDFTREADAVLAEFGLGRAHHRVLHFVNRNPGLRVADLLEVLKITKQSLARVLKQLVDEGWIAQHTGIDDRRERRLRVTEKGAGLARRLDQLQARRVAAALEVCGPENEAVVRQFLFSMISMEERGQVELLLPAGNTAAGRD